MRRNDHNEELKVLIRIIMRLFAMAETADRAALALPPVRFLVLWLLSFGEAVARGYAEDLAFEMGYDLYLPEHVWHGTGTEDAMRLGAQLRALAGVLHVLAGYVALLAAHRSFADQVLKSGRLKSLAVGQTSVCTERCAVRSAARAPPLLRHAKPYLLSRWCTRSGAKIACICLPKPLLHRIYVYANVNLRS